MIQIVKKEDCCGCTACANACPRDAIRMVPDEEGFFYPQVDQERCVSCGICDAVCPISASKAHQGLAQGYIIRYRDAAIVEQSTSGGAFTAFALNTLASGGVVYGAGYDENMRVVCKKATNPEDLREMRGSKFVQSNLGHTFRQIKSELEQGTRILFTGTPCQVEGLCAYLKAKPENLICIDFVCRGVPSPMLWENYVRMMQKKHGSKITGARFKHKTYGYHATTMKIDFENGKSYYGSGRVDPMMKAFVSELASRPSCGACAFKTLHRRSDLTMFDCYGFTKVTGMADDNKGYSSLIVQSEQGLRLLEAVKAELTVYPASTEALVEANGIMVRHSAKPNPKRSRFYSLAREMPIDQAMEQVSPITFTDRVIEGGKGLLYKVGLIRFAKAVKTKLRK